MKNDIKKHIIWAVVVVVLVMYLGWAYRYVNAQRTMFEFGQGECEMKKLAIQCK